MLGTQVSLSPRSQRLSIVLIWSFHLHCLNMGYPSDPWAHLWLPLLLPLKHMELKLHLVAKMRRFSPPPRLRFNQPITRLEIWYKNNVISFKRPLFTVWSDFYTALFRGEFKPAYLVILNRKKLSKFVKLWPRTKKIYRGVDRRRLSCPNFLNFQRIHDANFCS